jgi:hypothetical protein
MFFQPAPGPVSFLYPPQVRLSLPAKIKGMRTAFGEFAANDNIRQQWYGSRYFAQSFDPPFGSATGLGYRFEKPLGVGMKRPVEYISDARLFDNLTGIHDDHPRGHLSDNPQVVGDQQQ